MIATLSDCIHSHAHCGLDWNDLLRLLIVSVGGLDLGMLVVVAWHYFHHPVGRATPSVIAAFAASHFILALGLAVVEVTRIVEDQPSDVPREVTAAAAFLLGFYALWKLIPRRGTP